MEQFRSVVRPLVTLAFTFAFIWGFAVKLISAEAFLTMAGFVLKYWFDSRQGEKAKEPEKPIDLTEQVK